MKKTTMPDGTEIIEGTAEEFAELEMVKAAAARAAQHRTAPDNANAVYGPTRWLLDRDEKALIAAETTRQPTDMTTALKSEASTAERLEAMDTDLTNVYADEAKADTANREGMRASVLRNDGGRRFTEFLVPGDAALWGPAFDVSLRTKSVVSATFRPSASRSASSIARMKPPS